ncbi:MIP/aquaporin family protein [Stieleria varia]|uniref:Aquaporin Z 2 n=1 Tax=Stieleria varia TaxID=2528005 RepID=A0A5C6A608_9BACT|nr:MIP family channel protein [Stieleria varia]TWT93773.1 Aquaporin Z 2 [Stieleria varia]
MDAPLTRRCVAEFLGTYCLILMGCGAMVVQQRSELLTHPGVALTWGLVVMAMIYTFGHISGAHINPAVTIAMAALSKITWKETAFYVVVQCLGATAAAACLRLVLGMDESLLGATNSSLPTWSAFAVEFMMTTILMMVVMGVSTGAKEETITAGLAVGATIAIEAMVAGPLTKASMNPARSLGPALMSGSLDQLWIYLLAPIAGALTGAMIYRYLKPSK